MMGDNNDKGGYNEGKRREDEAEKRKKNIWDGI